MVPVYAPSAVLVKVPMVAMVSLLSGRAAPVAAAMAICETGPGSDAADLRPAAQRRTAKGGFLASRGMGPQGPGDESRAPAVAATPGPVQITSRAAATGRPRHKGRRHP